MSQEKRNIFKPFQTIVRGLTEVATVVFARKKVKTNFEKQEMDGTGESTEPPSDGVPLSKISDDDEVSISDEQLGQMAAFLSDHTTMDVKSFDCKFNGVPCEAVMCVFPRITKNDDGIPVVNDVVSMLITDGNDILAVSEYKSSKNVQEEFYKDMERVRHAPQQADYRTSFRSLVAELEESMMNARERIHTNIDAKETENTEKGG